MRATREQLKSFKLYPLIPIGKENAITTQELLQLSGYRTARGLQAEIAKERTAGAVICSGSRFGYWRPENRTEIENFIRTMRARANSTRQVIRSAEQLLSIPEGQLEIITGNQNE